MTEQGADGDSNVEMIYPQTERTQRRHLPWLIRYAIILTVGSCVGLVASYALKGIGY